MNRLEVFCLGCRKRRVSKRSSALARGADPVGNLNASSLIAIR